MKCMHYIVKGMPLEISVLRRELERRFRQYVYIETSPAPDGDLVMVFHLHSIFPVYPLDFVAYMEHELQLSEYTYSNTAQLCGDNNHIETIYQILTEAGLDTEPPEPFRHNHPDSSNRASTKSKMFKVHFAHWADVEQHIPDDANLLYRFDWKQQEDSSD